MQVGLTRRVHPVVERPEEAVRVLLGIGTSSAELVRDQLLGVGAQVSVRVAHQPDVGRLGNQDAVLEDFQRSHEHETVGEHRPLVHSPVAVRVFEHDDAADRIVLGRAGQIRHEARHFDSPETSVGVPVDRDRFLDQRLARHELDVIARRHVERLQGVLGRERWGFVRHSLNARRPRAVGRRALMPVHAATSAATMKIATMRNRRSMSSTAFTDHVRTIRRRAPSAP